MKQINYISIAALLLLGSATFAQKDYLDINNVKAAINGDGTLFTDGVNPGFEFPKGSGKHTLYTSGLWIGGLDGGNQLHLSAQTYKQAGSDFWSGPIDTAAISTDSTVANTWNRVWKINRSTVDSCEQGLFGSNPPQSVLDWPGSGDLSKGHTKALAPYVDKNANNVYEPLLGECPCMKGDQAIFFAFNDAKPYARSSGGSPIGLEIHGMAYAFNKPQDTAINNTIFVSYQIINRSAFPVDSCFIGNFTDFDIGDNMDDFVGSDVGLGAFYGYNGDNNDNVYGDTLAAQGVIMLQGPFMNIGGADLPKTTSDPRSASGKGFGDGVAGNERSGMSKFLAYNNDFTSTGNPSIAQDYYNYLSGSWKDSTAVTYGGTAKGGAIRASYMYPGGSDTLGYGTNGISQFSWSESNLTTGGGSNTPGERRGLGSYGHFLMGPGQRECISFAYVANRSKKGASNTQSVKDLQNRMVDVKQFFEANDLGDCGCNGTVSTGMRSIQSEESKLNVYPNPVNDVLVIESDVFGVQTKLELMDVQGRIVYDEILINSRTLINTSGLPSGIYLLRVQGDQNTITKRVIKN